jgi:hypothetical protein
MAWLGCSGSAIQEPDSTIGKKDSDKFTLTSFRLDGQEVTPKSVFAFPPGEDIQFEASWSADKESSFGNATVVMSFVSKAENIRTIAAECLFDDEEGVRGNTRSLSGTIKMPPPHMVEFMSKHSKSGDFSCALRDGNFVISECRVGFEQ